MNARAQGCVLHMAGMDQNESSAFSDGDLEGETSSFGNSVEKNLYPKHFEECVWHVKMWVACLTSAHRGMRVGHFWVFQKSVPFFLAYKTTGLVQCMCACFGGRDMHM